MKDWATHSSTSEITFRAFKPTFYFKYWLCRGIRKLKPKLCLLQCHSCLWSHGKLSETWSHGNLSESSIWPRGFVQSFPKVANHCWIYALQERMPKCQLFSVNVLETSKDCRGAAVPWQKLSCEGCSLDKALRLELFQVITADVRSAWWSGLQTLKGTESAGAEEIKTAGSPWDTSACPTSSAPLPHFPEKPPLTSGPLAFWGMWCMFCSSSPYEAFVM